MLPGTEQGEQWRVSRDKDGLWRFKGRIIVSEAGTLRQDILKEAHRTGFSIHLGSTKMYHDLKILKRIGPVAYRIALPPHLSNLHDVFHVSQFRKYTSDASHILETESVQLKEDLTFHVTPVRIDDTSIKRLRRKEVSLVKVAWIRAGIEEHTWELESEMRKDYPYLFSDCILVDLEFNWAIWNEIQVIRYGFGFS
ncbi:uncharacterized protein [Arachis hypogaea]|uniref:uncharacterized protein n=1 Tax=Arachis hypogaea TaxID=3818 RepID=UPI003B20C604